MIIFHLEFLKINIIPDVGGTRVKIYKVKAIDHKKFNRIIKKEMLLIRNKKKKDLLLVLSFRNGNNINIIIYESNSMPSEFFHVLCWTPDIYL